MSVSSVRPSISLALVLLAAAVRGDDAPKKDDPAKLPPPVVLPGGHLHRRMRGLLKINKLRPGASPRDGEVVTAISSLLT